MTTPEHPALLSAEQLSEALHDPRLRVLDASTSLVLDESTGSYMATPMREAYEEAHIPGAVFADVPGALSAPDATFDCTLPTGEYFAEQAGRLGIGNSSRVVVHDSGGAWATRLWWLFRVFGHDNVSVLDGGKRAWTTAGLTVESGPRIPDPGRFTAHFRPALAAGTEEVATRDQEAVCLVNALDPATFRGEQEVNPYPRRGRIPGSENLPFDSLLDPATGTFLPPAVLREKLDTTSLLRSGRPITYCGGGIAASLVAFAAYVVGQPAVAIYDGSLFEWTSDPGRPVDLGG
ncbi:sulfurtransferase [Streptomyces sp. NBC_01716]|uniref:sulfurtransferase n=1 Tax=Streptomyces sp. NBC_01716 TaxID=2975917 RepID=UPI002E3063BE|nr:sulfurtransferase [Streptomyces sp. NBC_01716]